MIVPLQFAMATKTRYYSIQHKKNPNFTASMEPQMVGSLLDPRFSMAKTKTNAQDWLVL